MTNSPIYVFDNIGCVVSLKNDKFNVLGPIFGYKTLDSNYDGSYIPYLVKDDQNWETGKHTPPAEAIPGTKEAIAPHGWA